MNITLDPYNLKRALRDGTTIVGGGGGDVKFSAGVLSALRSDITFANSNNVSFGLNGLGVITASVAAGGGGLTNIKLSAGTLSALRSDVTFSNSGGITFGLDTNGALTATVVTAYAGPGFTTSSTVGSNVAGTLSGNGLLLGVPNYLTTAQPPGAYLTTAQPAGTYAGTGFTTVSTTGSVVVGTLGTGGLNVGIPAYLTTAATAFPRLDQVLDPNTDKVFSMGGNMLQLQWATGGSFSTNATREGMFELDVQGNVTAEADVVHAHQHGGAPTKLDMIHVEGDGANVTGLRLQMSATVAAEINKPIKFTTEDSGYAIGSVPMILGTGMSNVVANLNANYLQGRVSSQMAGLGFTSASTAGTAFVATLSTNGLSMGIPVVGGGGVAISNSQSLFSTGTVGFSAGGGAITVAGSTSAGGQSLMFSVPQTSSLQGSGMMSVFTTGSTIGISAPNTSSMVGSGLISIGTTGSTIGFSIPNTSSMVGLGGISISTSGSTISISYSDNDTSTTSLSYANYYENMPTFPVNTTAITASGSIIQVVPFVLANPLTVAYLRIPASFSFVSTSHTSTLANTSYTINRTYSVGLVIYSNAAANFSSLQAVTSTSVSFAFQTALTAGATGSNYTVSYNVTYPVSGGYGNYATNVAVTNSSIQLSTNSHTLFSGARWLDIPFAISLSPNNYWLAVGGSTNSASNGGPGVLSQASLAPITMFGHSQTNLTFALQGAASASSVQVQPGLGSFSTNALQMTVANIDMSKISIQVSNPKLYFQMIRST